MKLGHVVLDSTKVRVNASRHKAMSYGRVKERAAQLKAEVDEEEDRRYGRDKRRDELPEAIQKARRKGMSLRAVKRALGIHRASIKKYMDADGSLDGGLGHLSPRQALVQCRYERVTFMLNP